MGTENSPAFLGHELRTLFAIIIANIDILEMEKGPSEWIDDIREECKRSTELINKLMEDPKPATPNESAFNVAEQIRRMTYFFRPLARQKGLHLEKNLNPDVISHIDRSEAVQVFSVLVGNAVKYCDPDGLIKVGLTPQGNKFRFTVTNTFADASEKEAQRFFESHYRGAHTQERDGGYGVGLAFAHAIVEEHNGSLDVEADEENGEITFVMVM